MQHRSGVRMTRFAYRGLACLLLGIGLAGPAVAAEGLRGRFAIEVAEAASDAAAQQADARVGMLTRPREERFNPVLGLCLLSGLVLSGVLALVREVRAEREEKMQSDASTLR